mmetsp:Transcript_5278/g.15656  ORF Transcript_5278/g.15656 Transcript_5278/m.15656 type:complete len:291 (+) Transcript_5278:522-1394(+)
MLRAREDSNGSFCASHGARTPASTLSPPFVSSAGRACPGDDPDMNPMPLPAQASATAAALQEAVAEDADVPARASSPGPDTRSASLGSEPTYSAEGVRERLPGVAPADGAAPRKRGLLQRHTLPWSRTEDEVIAEAVARFGCKWGVLAALLPGRTCASVRNRWHRLKLARRSTGEHKEGAPAQEDSEGWVMDALQADAGGESDALHVDRRGAGDVADTSLRFADRSSRTKQAHGGGGGGGGYKCSRCGQPKRGHLCSESLNEAAYREAQNKMARIVETGQAHSSPRTQAP